MHPRSDESPPPQHDPASERAREGVEEPRNFETGVEQRTADPDTGAAWTDDPDINTHGSER
jgi:hypothetical protein